MKWIRHIDSCGVSRLNRPWRLGMGLAINAAGAALGLAHLINPLAS